MDPYLVLQQLQWKWSWDSLLCFEMGAVAVNHINPEF
jgi:hypothetical protein